jgi:hypothetical protein
MVDEDKNETKQDSPSKTDGVETEKDGVTADGKPSQELSK